MSNNKDLYGMSYITDFDNEMGYRCPSCMEILTYYDCKECRNCHALLVWSTGVSREDWNHPLIPIEQVIISTFMSRIHYRAEIYATKLNNRA